MMDIASKFAERFVNTVAKESSKVIRDEVEYVTGTIKKSIRDGFREGFNAIRANIFYLFFGMGCTLLGMIFAVWGLAKVFAEYFDKFGEGAGFLVFGLLALLIGFISFAMSKPK